MKQAMTKFLAHMRMIIESTSATYCKLRHAVVVRSVHATDFKSTLH